MTVMFCFSTHNLYHSIACLILITVMSHFLCLLTVHGFMLEKRTVVRYTFLTFSMVLQDR